MKKIGIWQRLFGGSHSGQSKGLEAMWERFVQGIPPAPDELDLMSLSLEQLAEQWKNAVQGGEAEKAWRFARVLGLEEYWQERLKTGQPEEKERVLEQIASLPVAETSRMLRTAVEDKSPSVGLTAALLLAQRDEASTTAYFLGLIARSEGGPWVDRGARGLVAHRTVKPGEVWSGLLEAVGDSRSFFRSRVWEVISNLGPLREGEIEEDVLVQALKRGINDSDGDVRAKSMEALGSLALMGVDDLLLKGLADEEAVVRAQALKAASCLAVLEVAMQHRDEIKSKLSELLTDEDWKVSAWAKEALRYY